MPDLSDFGLSAGGQADKWISEKYSIITILIFHIKIHNLNKLRYFFKFRIQLSFILNNYRIASAISRQKTVWKISLKTYLDLWMSPRKKSYFIPVKVQWKLKRPPYWLTGAFDLPYRECCNQMPLLMHVTRYSYDSLYWQMLEKELDENIEFERLDTVIFWEDRKEVQQEHLVDD